MECIHRSHTGFGVFSICYMIFAVSVIHASLRSYAGHGRSSSHEGYGLIIGSLLFLQKTFVLEPIFHPIGPGGNGLFSAAESVAVSSFTVYMHLG